MERKNAWAVSCIAAVFSACSVGAQAAIVSGTFNVTSADMTTLYSATLDAPCTTAGGQFFTCTDVAEVQALATSVNITNTSTGSGTLTLQYDDATGEITSVDSLDLSVSDMSIFITTASLGDATVIVTGGNGVPGPNDVPTVLSGTAGVNGSADADSNAAANIFQHDAPGNETDAADFSTFSDIVDSCTAGAPVCGLIPVLNIDGARYELTGLVSGAGPFSLALRSETLSNTNYFVDLTAEVIPLPAAVWLFGSALGLLGWIRRRYN